MPPLRITPTTEATQHAAGAARSAPRSTRRAVRRRGEDEPSLASSGRVTIEPPARTVPGDRPRRHSRSSCRGSPSCGGERPHDLGAKHGSTDQKAATAAGSGCVSSAVAGGATDCGAGCAARGAASPGRAVARAARALAMADWIFSMGSSGFRPCQTEEAGRNSPDKPTFCIIRSSSRSSGVTCVCISQSPAGIANSTNAKPSTMMARRRRTCPAVRK